MFGRLKNWLSSPQKFRLPPEKSPDEKVAELFKEIAEIFYIGWHDGNLDFESDVEVWEQGYAVFDDAWMRLTVPSNAEALRKRIGTTNGDWERLIKAAYRKSLWRSQPFKRD
jgi:hypothetical protein